MKKKGWFITGVLCAAAFEAGMFFLTVSVLDPVRNPGRIVEAVVLLCLLGYCVNHACVQYDRADGFVSGSTGAARWFCNTLFLGLVVMYGTAAWMMVKGSYASFALNVNGRRTAMMVLTVLIALAMVLYFRSGLRNRSRKARIRSLKNESSRYGRRYTMMITDSHQAMDGKHVEVEGFVHGTIRKGDSVTLEYPGIQTEKYKVLNLHVGENSSLSAGNNDVKVVLSCPYDEKKKIEKYTVLSDLIAVHGRRDMNQTENPMLNGVIADYGKYARDPAFQGVLVYALMYSEFLVPGKIVHGKNNGDIMDPLTETSDVGFPTLSSRQNPEMKILPVFTDWDALSRWQDMMKEADAVTVTADFPMAVELMRKGFQGFVVNPFGPRAFFLSDAFAESVMRMPGYREEMIQRKEKQQ